MDNSKVLPFILFYTLMFPSCTTSQIESNNLSEKIRIIDIESWLNMMPGGPGSFHIIGKYECLDTAFCDAKLINIKVYSDSLLIYDIAEENINCETQIENDTQSIKYAFFTQPSIKLNEKIQTIEKIDVKLIFDFGTKSIEKDFRDIILTRAY
jgi:hypothetical protein